MLASYFKFIALRFSKIDIDDYFTRSMQRLSKRVHPKHKNVALYASQMRGRELVITSNYFSVRTNMCVTPPQPPKAAVKKQFTHT